MTTPDPTSFCFIVEVATGDQPWQSAELEIREHDDLAKAHYLGVWHKLYQALQKQYELDKRTAPEWLNWKPGEWCDQKRGYEPRLKFIAICGPNLVGFLNCWPDIPSVVDSAKRILYIEHLATAPGNMDTELWRKRFRYVGQSLLAYAVMLSQQRGFEGRLGFHVADERALGFYRRINERHCSGRLFHPERRDIPGPTPRGEHERSKTYLETVEAAANDWLEGYRRV
jgi:ribosomal protein S18 acetylase RimI-like enzyme